MTPEPQFGPLPAGDPTARRRIRSLLQRFEDIHAPIAFADVDCADGRLFRGGVLAGFDADSLSGMFAVAAPREPADAFDPGMGRSSPVAPRGLYFYENFRHSPTNAYVLSSA
jgi:hypothetical protein